MGGLSKGGGCHRLLRKVLKDKCWVKKEKGQKCSRDRMICRVGRSQNAERN